MDMSTCNCRCNAEFGIDSRPVKHTGCLNPTSTHVLITDRTTTQTLNPERLWLKRYVITPDLTSTLIQGGRLVTSETMSTPSYLGCDVQLFIKQIRVEMSQDIPGCVSNWIEKGNFHQDGIRFLPSTALHTLYTVQKFVVEQFPNYSSKCHSSNRDAIFLLPSNGDGPWWKKNNQSSAAWCNLYTVQKNCSFGS